MMSDSIRACHNQELTQDCRRVLQWCDQRQRVEVLHQSQRDGVGLRQLQGGGGHPRVQSRWSTINVPRQWRQRQMHRGGGESLQSELGPVRELCTLLPEPRPPILKELSRAPDLLPVFAYNFKVRE